MWSDNETNRDFLNFRMVADTAAEVIVQADGQPLSLGVSGSWGVGKSSMIRLIQDSLTARGDSRFIFVEFNAWLYQGYDDARAALLDVIAQRLVAHAEETKTGLTKAKDLLSRVDWLRLLKFGGSAAALAMGLPPPGLVGDLVEAAKSIGDGKADAGAIAAITGSGEEVTKAGKSLIKDKKALPSPPKEIQNLRNHFESTLAEMGVRLVVFVDDLDRCLPETSIATLEAMRLFLFLKGTAFVIAADDKMIRQAVKAHFKDANVDDALVTNYFDKLIQVPLRVPPLGTQDVRAYLMMLYIENSTLLQEQKDTLRQQICRQLGETWQGKRVDRAFVAGLIANCPPALMSRLDTADRLAPLMASSPQIAGNPRLIKRFLNTLSIRMTIAAAQGVKVDEAALAKMLLFERCGGDTAYANIVAEINDDGEGKPRSLKALEAKALANEKLEPLPGGWDEDFAQDWLAVPPALAEMDLRPVVHVSREHFPIITAADQLSSDAAKLLAGLLGLTQASTVLNAGLTALGKRERGFLMDRLLARAQQVQEWSSEKELAACLTLARVDPEQGPRIAALLGDVPVRQLRPGIVPTIRREPWAAPVLARWSSATDVPPAVKKAITETQKGKN